MIESPVLQEFLAKRQRKWVMLVLIERFGSRANAIAQVLDSITDVEKLDKLTRIAVKCPDIETFEHEITSRE